MRKITKTHDAQQNKERLGAVTHASPVGLNLEHLQSSRRSFLLRAERESCIIMFFFNQNVDLSCFKKITFFQPRKKECLLNLSSIRFLRKAIKSGILLNRRRFGKRAGNYQRDFFLIMFFQSKFYEVIFKIEPGFVCF